MQYFRENGVRTYFTVCSGSLWFFQQILCDQTALQSYHIQYYLSLTASARGCLKTLLALNEDKENPVCYTLFFLTLRLSSLINAQSGITLYIYIF